MNRKLLIVLSVALIVPISFIEASFSSLPSFNSVDMNDSAESLQDRMDSNLLSFLQLEQDGSSNDSAASDVIPIDFMGGSVSGDYSEEWQNVEHPVSFDEDLFSVGYPQDSFDVAPNVQAHAFVQVDSDGEDDYLVPANSVVDEDFIVSGSSSSSSSDDSDDSVLAPEGERRLGDGIRRDEQEVSPLNLSGDSSVGNSSINMITPESPNVVSDVRSALFSSLAFKAKISQEKLENWQSLVARVEWLENGLRQNICTWSWFNREIERLKIAYDELM